MPEGLSDFRITQTDLRVHVSPGREVAWATCLWDFRARSGDQGDVEPTRCTWVLERRALRAGGRDGPRTVRLGAVSVRDDRRFRRAVTTLDIFGGVPPAAGPRPRRQEALR
jgi:hypothetical protein